MKKKQIEDKYNNYINLFKKYNEYYYNKNKPIVSDKIFDERIQELNVCNKIIGKTIKNNKRLIKVNK